MDNSSTVIVINFGTKNILKIVLAIQLAVLGAIGLDLIGIKIPILRQAICFIYLSFIPGIVILRILKMHKVSTIETILYAVGLTLSLLMFTGALINFLYPLIGISKPISEISLVITISVVVLFLCFVCYLRDKDYSTSFYIDMHQITSPLVLSLLLFPFLAIFGAYLLNFHDNNNLLLFLLAIISIIPAIVAFNKIPEKIYPLIIWTIAIALVLHISLSSMYVSLTDNTAEYYISNLVIANGYWDTTLPNNLNALLSVVMLIPIFHNVSGVDLTWIFKIILPLLVSFIPLGLYEAFKRQTNDKIAFFSCFFFMSMVQFYIGVNVTMKVASAYFFLALFVLLITNNSIYRIKKVILLIVFAFALISSHYGTSYILFFSLIGALFILLFWDKSPKNNLHRKPINIITPTFVLLYATLVISWYMYASGSSGFTCIVHLGPEFINTIYTDFLLPEGSTTSYILFSKLSLSMEILKYLYLISCFFITIGVINLYYKPMNFKFNDEYKSISTILYIINFSGFIGFFSNHTSPERILFISSFFLAPFCVIGGIIVINNLKKIVKKHYTHTPSESVFPFKSLSIFFIIFLLLNSGFVSELITKDHSGASILINKKRIIESGTIEDKICLYSVYPLEYDIFGTQWLSKYKYGKTKVYGDYVSRLVPLTSYGGMGLPPEAGPPVGTYVLTNYTKIEKETYIFLRYFNNIEGLMVTGISPPLYYNTTELFPILKNKIYSNGYCVIYYNSEK